MRLTRGHSRPLRQARCFHSARRRRARRRTRVCLTPPVHRSSLVAADKTGVDDRTADAFCGPESPAERGPQADHEQPREEFGDRPAGARRTVTFDRGAEFAACSTLEIGLCGWKPTSGPCRRHGKRPRSRTPRRIGDASCRWRSISRKCAERVRSEPPRQAVGQPQRSVATCRGSRQGEPVWILIVGWQTGNIKLAEFPSRRGAATLPVSSDALAWSSDLRKSDRLLARGRGDAGLPHGAGQSKPTAGRRATSRSDW